MSGKNRSRSDRFELPLSVWTYPVYKTSWASLPDKQAITVGSSSGFNVKLLHDWSDFDLPKLMPVEHIFLMPSACYSHCHANKLLITAYIASQEFADASVRSNEQKGGSYSRRSLPSLPNSPPFFLPLYPLPFSTPATQAALLLTIRSWARNAADINL